MLLEEHCVSYCVWEGSFSIDMLLWWESAADEELEITVWIYTGASCLQLTLLLNKANSAAKHTVLQNYQRGLEWMQTDFCFYALGLSIILKA